MRLYAVPITLVMRAASEADAFDRAVEFLDRSTDPDDNVADEGYRVHDPVCIEQPTQFTV